MKGDIGISTLIIFIVIVLIATVAAIVLLNAANTLKNQAQITQKESEAKFTKRFEITDVYGWVDTNSSSPTYGRIKFIGITARIPKGGDFVPLTDTVLQFSTGNVIKTATYISPAASNDIVVDPCNNSADDVFNMLTEGTWLKWAENPDFAYAAEAYHRFMNGDYYTVGWIICKADVEMINGYNVYPGQLVRIYYAPPDGLLPGERVTITLLVSSGGTTSVEFRVPDVFQGSVVRLYPP